MYFDGITSVRSQNAQSILQLSDAYLDDLQRSIDAGTEPPAPEFIDEELINSFLYVPLQYRPTNFNPSTDAREQILQDFSLSAQNVSE